MSPRLLAALGLALALTSCGDSSQPAPQPAQQDDSPSAGGASYAEKGSGEVAIGQTEGDKTTIAQRYQKALQLVQKRDWDGARGELLEAYQRSPDDNVRKEIREHLKLVEQGLLEQPALTVAQAFGAAEKLYDRNISLRGRYIPGGAVGKVSYYFWLENGRKIQVRYGQLRLDDKKAIHALKEGARILVRGPLKSPWGSNPHPYLEATFFHRERGS